MQNRVLDLLRLCLSERVDREDSSFIDEMMHIFLRDHLLGFNLTE